jgi:hypothetical protein
MGQKKVIQENVLLQTIVGFVAADPEQRQARNEQRFEIHRSIARQRSWKNAEDEWVSKVEWQSHRDYMELGVASIRRRGTTMSEIQLPNSCELAPGKHCGAGSCGQGMTIALCARNLLLRRAETETLYRPG